MLGFDVQDEATQEKVLAGLLALAQGGPSVGRPLVDTIKGSRFTNLKELRVQHQGEPLRAFFAFDPLRQAIVLCAGKRAGTRSGFTKRCCRWLRHSTPGIWLSWRKSNGKNF